MSKKGRHQLARKKGNVAEQAPGQGPTRWAVKGGIVNGAPRIQISDYLSNQQIEMSLEEALWLSGAISFGAKGMLEQLAHMAQKAREQQGQKIIVPNGANHA